MTNWDRMVELKAFEQLRWRTRNLQEYMWRTRSINDEEYDKIEEMIRSSDWDNVNMANALLEGMLETRELGHCKYDTTKRDFQV